MERFDETIHLTEREIMILELLIEGLNNQAIADRLNVSIHTVKAHLESIYRKFNVHNKVQALVCAVINEIVVLK